MQIFVVIPVYNRKQLTRECLIRLRQQTESNFRIVVIDDASSDGTPEMVATEFPKVALLPGNGNLWWAGGVNKGIEYVLSVCHSDDYVLLLNDDLLIEADYIARCNQAVVKHPNTLIGSVLVDNRQKNVISGGGISINWKTAKWYSLNVGKRLSEFPDDYWIEVSTLTGRGVLIPVKVFRDTGLYDSQHIEHCGDIELPARAARKGYKLIIDYSLIVYGDFHDIGHISLRNSYRLADIREYFWGMKSYTNLRYRFWFAYNTSRNFPAFLRYFVFDLARVCGHLIRRLELR